MDVDSPERLLAMGQLARGISHDFNNLLTVIMGHADLLAAALPQSSPAYESVVEIQRAAGSAASLTRQLLAFARQQPLMSQVLDLAALVHDSARLLHSLVGDEILVDLPPADRPSLIEADRSQLEQVLINLTVNAKDAMPDGGRLTFSLEEITGEAGMFGAHVAVTPGRYALLTITDTGQGMDAGAKARMFEPFFSTKHSSGLGLATVYGIVKQSGGFIFVDSEPGRGTRFRLYFPSAERADMPGPAPSAAKSGALLLVDDEDSVRSMVATNLRRSGYEVLEARTGEEGLAIATSEGDRLALLITDERLPGISGTELASRLSPHVKVLVISGAPPSVEHAPVLLKPFTRADLLRQVAALVNERKI
jgi:CheY-like chemotaxis protein